MLCQELMHDGQRAGGGAQCLGILECLLESNPVLVVKGMHAVLVPGGQDVLEVRAIPSVVLEANKERP